MIRRPPISTRTDTLFPYTTLFRSFADEARQWAIGPYATALLKGQKLEGEERAQIRRELSRFTGLSETYLESADLSVTPSRFYKELLRDRGLRSEERRVGQDGVSTYRFRCSPYH